MKHCLIVDDSHVIRKVACQILEGMKFYAEEAQESASALNVCRVQMPDIVLVDLAEASGIEFVRALRRGHSDKQPVVIGTLVEHDAGHIAAALQAGTDQYVMKPFDRDSLVAKFAQAGLASLP